MTRTTSLAIVVVLCLLAMLLPGVVAFADDTTPAAASVDILAQEKSIQEIRSDLDAGRYTSHDLVVAYMKRIAALDTGWS